jgi:hypothetical protein
MTDKPQTTPNVPDTNPREMRSAEEWYAKRFEPAQADSLVDKQEMLRFIRAIQTDALASRAPGVLEGWNRPRN